MRPDPPFHQQYHSPVSRDKLLNQIRNNPAGSWSIENLKTIATQNGIDFRQGATSHVVFIAEDGRTFVVPARRPIKPIYLRKFVKFVEG